MERGVVRGEPSMVSRCASGEVGCPLRWRRFAERDGSKEFSEREAPSRLAETLIGRVELSRCVLCSLCEKAKLPRDWRSLALTEAELSYLGRQ